MQAIESLIGEAGDNENFELNARCELLLLEGSKNNMDHVKQIAWVNAAEAHMGVNSSLRAQAGHALVQSHSLWFQNVERLKKRAKERKNLFVYYNALVHESSVIYEFIVCTGLLSLQLDRPQIVAPMPDQKPLIDQLYQNLERSKAYYQTIGHPQNELVAHSIYYELLHFEGRTEEGAVLMREMEALAELYELGDQKRRLEHLKNGGCRHEKLRALTETVFASFSEEKQEVEGWIFEMEQMDEQERAQKADYKDSYQIQLFPIGFFQFPRSEVDNVLELIGIKDAAVKAHFRWFFNNDIIPIANIYHAEIKAEGPLKGHLEEKGISSWRNIYRIRRTFFERKYYRFEPFGAPPS